MCVESTNTSRTWRRKQKVGQILYSLRTRTTRINPVLPELAMKLYNEPESNIKIITRNDDVSGKMFRSYVQLNKPGKQPMLKCSTAALQKTLQESLEALMMTLRQAVEEEAMRSAQETFDKAFGAEATEGVAGENSGS